MYRRTLWTGSVLAAALFFTITDAAVVIRAAPLPESVKLVRKAAAEDGINLQLSLKRQNMDQLEKFLRAVSDPFSPKYGQYMSDAEVHEIFRPTEDSFDQVIDWLTKSGFGNLHITPQAAAINVATTVETADQLFGANFSWFDVDGTPKLRTGEYTIPDRLVEHVDLVSPTTYFGRMRPPPRGDGVNDWITENSPEQPAPLNKRDTKTESDQARDHPSWDSRTPDCATIITPPCLETAYNYKGYIPDPKSGSRVSFTSFLEQAAQQADLTKFLSLTRLEGFRTPASKKKTFKTVLINGGESHEGVHKKSKTSEANLDVQWLAAVTQTKLPITQWITGGRPPFVPNLRIPTPEANTNEPYLEFLEYLFRLPDKDLPQVISNSYAEDEQSVPEAYARRVCGLLGIMGLRGVTVLTASGDSGVGAPCRANDGSGREEFSPQFPSSCPYITTVGGTQAWDPEVAWKGSSGGFSNYFPRPWYQVAAVEKYLEEQLDPAAREYYEENGFVRFAGRAFPDLSAHSSSPKYAYVDKRVPGLTGGTSASCPVVAGIVGLLNDARLRRGLPTMGFINPWLYAKGYQALEDVTGGAAVGCQGIDIQTGKRVPGAGIIPGASWNATPDWDPATGLGLPNFWAMRELALED
ncbi:tripeptidyl-peptidase [Sodiomyces alkalinus F11]|uniref:tripeptidyl-peptidase II n=1 Tax=Sodiomyces alkalinus (strain CBS 110278 / VKM F-3762 / F11) TaxID=1314773 RepID=A0A3N2Q0G3_SODAK|nr:tripeptidyl-peptidase [Sodiomyces alkalinus F11]ROT40230.1 tripeptidyl-peptidase [Sodiomyces alkalinus F11]